MEVGAEVLGQSCILAPSVSSDDAVGRLARLVPGIRSIALASAFFASCTSGQYLAFGVVMEDFRSYFSMSQAAVEFLYSMNILGLCSGYLALRIVRWYDARAAQFLALLVSSVPAFFIWVATRNPSSYSAAVALQAFHFLVLGIGSGLSFATAMATAVRNYPSQHHWIVTGIVSAGHILGALFFILVYNGQYCSNINGGEAFITPYFLLIFFLTLFANLFAFLSYGYYEIDVSPNERSSLRDSSTSRSEASSYSGAGDILQTIGGPRRQYEDPVNQDLTLSQILRNSIFLSLSLPYIITVSLYLTHWGNISTYLVTVGRTRWLWGICLFPLLIGLISKWGFIHFTDKWKDRVPRAWYIVIACGFCSLSYVIAIFLLHSGVVQYLLYITWTLCAVSVSLNAHHILVHEFGADALHRMYGILMVATSLLSFILINTLSAFYSLHAEAGTCSGETCFTGIFACAGFLSILSFIVSGMYLLRRVHRRTVFSLQPASRLSSVNSMTDHELTEDEDLLYIPPKE